MAADGASSDGVEAAPQDLAALIAENLRLKEELLKLSKEGYTLSKPAGDAPSSVYRPPWQSQAREAAQATLRPKPSQSQGPVRWAPPVVSAPERSSILTRNGAVSAPSLGLASGEPSSIQNLRQSLLQITGSLPEAFKALDAKGTSSLDMPTMTRVLEALEAKSGKPLPTAASVFTAMSLGYDEAISIPKLLEYNPAKQRSALRQMDTQALWKAYTKEKSAHSRSLDRGPRWKPNAKSERPLPPDSWAEHLEAVRRRRDLRKQFREDRQGIKAEQKRELILGVSPYESHLGMREQEHRNLEVHRQRIQNAIRGCSRARFNLVEIQKQMAGLVKDDTEVSSALQGIFRNKLQFRSEIQSDDEESQGVRGNSSADVSPSGRVLQRSNKSLVFDLGRQQQSADEELSSHLD